MLQPTHERVQWPKYLQFILKQCATFELPHFSINLLHKFHNANNAVIDLDLLPILFY